MALTVNAKTYDKDTERTPDIVRYTGPAATLSSKDQLDAARVPPKSTEVGVGRGKARIKITRALTDGTDPVGDGIIEVHVSLPVGAAAAEMQALVTDLGTFMLTATADEILIDQDITH